MPNQFSKWKQVTVLNGLECTQQIPSARDAGTVLSLQHFTLTRNSLLKKLFYHYLAVMTEEVPKRFNISPGLGGWCLLGNAGALELETAEWVQFPVFGSIPKCMCFWSERQPGKLTAIQTANAFLFQGRHGRRKGLFSWHTWPVLLGQLQ